MKPLNLFRSFFKFKEPDTPGKTTLSLKEVLNDPGHFDFNQDLYCQIEFLSVNNFENASKTADEITEISEQDYDGFAWWESYERSEAKFPTGKLQINPTAFARLLQEYGFTEFNTVSKSQSDTAILLDNTRAFTKGSIVICFNFDMDILQNIWLNVSPSAKDHAAYTEILLEIGKKYNFLLADWWKSIIVDITDPNEIAAYFELE